MRALDRKLIRDLLQMKGQALAISLVMACGVATFVLSLTTLGSLRNSQQTYYDRYHFADVFAHVKRAPNSLTERIADIPGVGAVQTRVVMDVTLDVPGVPEPATGRLISIPDRTARGLNDIHLRSGRWVEPGRRGEVLVSEAFADANGFKPGDEVKAILNGKLQPLKIVGIALSPEYIYAIRPGELMPDDRRFGIFWMSATELAPAFNMEGAFNDVALSLTPGASEADVIQRLDRVLDPYGCAGSYGRSEQISNKFVSNELTQLRAMAMVAPSIFLSVAAFLLNIVLSRIVNTQREQIAALRAFGYARWQIGLHYLKMIFLLVFFGWVIGTIAGAYLGREMTGMYAMFFHFPIFDYQFDIGVALLALLVAGTAATLGALAAVRRAAIMPPAEAMRPEPPAKYRRTVLERLGLSRFLSQAMRMVLRNLERQPLRSLMTIIGIALATSVLVLGSFVQDVTEYVIDFQFSAVQRQDATITFIEPPSITVLHEVRNLPGVIDAEPFRSVAVRMRMGHRTRRLGIMGLDPGMRLFRVLDANEQLVPLPDDGLVISDKLADLLGVRVGDDVTLEVLEGERPVRTVPIAAIMVDYTEASAYMNIAALNRVLREGDCISGAFLTIDVQERGKLYTRLKEMPKVAGVSVKEAALRSFQHTLEENLLRMRTMNVIFACIIAFGVVYNSARISLAERSRELATLRVMGFTRREISTILLGELAVLTLVAIPLGLLMGSGLAKIATVALETETQKFPYVVYDSTYAFAATVTSLAACISALIVRRRLDELNLVAVLKSRE
jgi:putative ABC transport system permease protein